MSKTLRELEGQPNPWPMIFEVGEEEDGSWYVEPRDADGTKGPRIHGSDPAEVLAKLSNAMTKASLIAEGLVLSKMLEGMFKSPESPKDSEWKPVHE